MCLCCVAPILSGKRALSLSQNADFGKNSSKSCKKNQIIAAISCPMLSRNLFTRLKGGIIPFFLKMIPKSYSKFFNLAKIFFNQDPNPLRHKVFLAY